jgi:hypothetical protein
MKEKWKNKALLLSNSVLGLDDLVACNMDNLETLHLLIHK